MLSATILNEALTLITLWANSAANKLIFSYFSQKIDFDTLEKIGDSLHKLSVLFSRI